MKIPSKIITLKNGKTLTLRSATVADATALLDHLKISHTESYRNLNTNGQYWENMPVADEEKLLAHFEKASNKFMLIADTGHGIVGGLGLFGQEKEFTRHNAGLGISIQNAWAGTGLGTAMVEFALESARKCGLHRIDLTVRTYNTAAMALYEKTGFRRVGLLKDMALIDGQYVDEYYYELIL